MTQAGSPLRTVTPGRSYPARHADRRRSAGQPRGRPAPLDAAPGGAQRRHRERVSADKRWQRLVGLYPVHSPNDIGKGGEGFSRVKAEIGESLCIHRAFNDWWTTTPVVAVRELNPEELPGLQEHDGTWPSYPDQPLRSCYTSASNSQTLDSSSALINLPNRVIATADTLARVGR